MACSSRQGEVCAHSRLWDLDPMRDLRWLDTRYDCRGYLAEDYAGLGLVSAILPSLRDIPMDAAQLEMPGGVGQEVAAPMPHMPTGAYEELIRHCCFCHSCQCDAASGSESSRGQWGSSNNQLQLADSGLEIGLESANIRSGGDNWRGDSRRRSFRRRLVARQTFLI